MIEERFLDIMTDPAVVALLGNRFYPLFVSKAVVPYAVYIIFDESREYTYDHESNDNVIMQVSIFGDDYNTCQSSKNAILNALEQYSWTNTQFILQRSKARYFYEKDTKRYHCAVDLEIWSGE